MTGHRLSTFEHPEPTGRCECGDWEYTGTDKADVEYQHDLHVGTLRGGAHAGIARARAALETAAGGGSE